MSQVVHLFGPKGKPTSSPGERAFLRDLRRMDGPLEIALADYNHALIHDDVAAGIRAARRLLSIGSVLRDAEQVMELRKL